MRPNEKKRDNIRWEQKGKWHKRRDNESWERGEEKKWENIKWGKKRWEKTKEWEIGPNEERREDVNRWVKKREIKFEIEQ